MSLGFKLIVPSVLALSLAGACVPDLDSLSAEYSATSSGGSGGKGVVNPEGGSNTSNAGNTSTGGSGPVDTCTNGNKDSKESDVDCGGTSKCDRCTKGFKCTANNDCESAICKGGNCTAASCTDNVQNQDETGVDCGGTCLPCEVNQPCKANADCEGFYCLDGLCADHCTSGITEPSETDKDCGGSCEPCDDKLKCNNEADCKSKICTNGKCVVPTCNDGVKNQGESETDCGAICAPAKACGVGVHCNSEADCESWICSGTTAKCVADTVVVAANNMIDDFEDGVITSLPALGGRLGNWYAYADSSGGTGLLAEATIINRGASKQGLHTKGKNFTQWGSGVGCDLAHGGSDKLTYDASAFTGVTFWARGTGLTSLNVAFPDIDTDKLVKGKTCMEECDHHYFKSVPLTTAWARYNIAFADLSLEPGDKPAPTAFRPDAVSAIQFRMVQGSDYEVYIDDLGFVN